PDRRAFEKGLLSRPGLSRAALHLLRVILEEWHWGKADSYPSNAMIADLMGITPRHVQRILAELEALGVIVTAVDRSMTSQRRTILADHPNAPAILADLRANPNVVVGAKLHAPRGDKSPPKNMHLGVTKAVHLGVTKAVHLGVSKMSPESRIPLTPDFESL